MWKSGFLFWSVVFRALATSKISSLRENWYLTTTGNLEERMLRTFKVEFHHLYLMIRIVVGFGMHRRTSRTKDDGVGRYSLCRKADEEIGSTINSWRWFPIFRNLGDMKITLWSGKTVSDVRNRQKLNFTKLVQTRFKIKWSATLVISSQLVCGL